MLEHHTHLTTDQVDIGGRIRDLGAIKGDGAGSGFFQKVQAAQESGLTGAGGTDNDDLLTDMDMLGDVIENL